LASLKSFAYFKPELIQRQGSSQFLPQLPASGFPHALVQFPTFEDPVRLIAPQQLRERERIDRRILFRQPQEGDRSEFIGGIDLRYTPPIGNMKRKSIQVPNIGDYYGTVKDLAVYGGLAR
jgi:hypothetical protein